MSSICTTKIAIYANDEVGKRFNDTLYNVLRLMKPGFLKDDYRKRLSMKGEVCDLRLDEDGNLYFVDDTRYYPELDVIYRLVKNYAPNNELIYSSIERDSNSFYTNDESIFFDRKYIIDIFEEKNGVKEDYYNGISEDKATDILEKFLGYDGKDIGTLVNMADAQDGITVNEYKWCDISDWMNM